MSTPGIELLGPFLTNRFGDRYLWEVNRSAFDRVGSAAVYQKYFGDDLFQPNRLYVIVGTDSGVLLCHLKKHAIPEGTRYLLVELSKVIESLKAAALLEDLPEKVRVVALEDFGAQVKAFQLQNYLYLGAIDLRESLAAMDANLPEYRDLCDHLCEQLRTIEWATISQLGCRDFVIRQLENLGENRIPAIHFKGRFAGKTAVILAGGPSLDEILPWVRDHQDEVAIFAVSRVSRRLLQFDLVPHLIFSVDPHDVSFDVSREMLHFWEKSLFVHSYHVSPKLLGQWRGRSVYIGDRYPWACDGNVNNLTSPGPTVTNSALAMAVDMGFSQIVLAGVDLCFSKSGMTHATGSFESVAGPKLDNVLTVETNGGWLAETQPDLHKAKEVLNQQAAIAEKAGCRVVNPASGAAKVPNVRYLPLSEIDVEPLDCSLVAAVLKLLPADGPQQRIKHYRLVSLELKRVKAQLRKIKELADEALRCNKGLFGKNGKPAHFKYKIRMDKIEKRLNRDFSGLIPLVKKFGIQNFLKINRLDNEKEWSDEEIEKTADVYYEAYRESAARLLELVEQGLVRIDIREKEILHQAPLESLSEIWRRDGQPGRVHIWRNGRSAQAFSTGDEVLVAQLEKEYDAMITDPEPFQLKRARHQRSLAPVRGKALRMFKAKDVAGLERIIIALENQAEQKEATDLRFLIQGYMAEIKLEYSEALEHYQALIGETFENLTEDALKRIASVGLQTSQVEFAKLALECLANATFVYKPQYADLLRLLGHHQSAADVYVEYLERVPSDISVLIKLGQLYQTMGAMDVARQVFQMVLAQDPENAAARELCLGDL